MVTISLTSVPGSSIVGLMAGLRVFLAAILLALPLWVTFATPASACTCGHNPLEARVSRADLIVVGTGQGLKLLGPVPAAPPLSPPGQAVVSGGPGESTVAVEEYVKGSGPSTLSLYVASTTVIFDEAGQIVRISGPLTSCAVTPQSGDRFLLFLTQRQDGRYDTDVCAGSVGFDGNDAAVLALIQQIRLILQGPSPTATVNALPRSGAAVDSSAGKSLWPVLAAGGVGLLLSSSALFLLRRPQR